MAMLQTMLQRLSRRQEAFTAPEPQPVKKPDPLVQLAPLFALMEGRKFIDVFSLRSGERFQSVILGVDLAGARLELDELFCASGQFMHFPGEQFSVRYHQAGEVMSFDTTLIEIRDGSGNPVYYFSLPQQLKLEQRRRHARLTLGRQQPVGVKLISPFKMRWHATAINISQGGMRLVIGGNVLDQLQKSAVLPACEFSLSDTCRVNCSARVLSYRFQRRPYRQTEVSIEFLDLSNQGRNQLGDLVDSCVPFAA